MVNKNNESDSSEASPAETKVTPLRAPRPCPECGKPSSRDAYPFCSVRCRNIDLNRWLSGSYVIPGPPLELDDDNSDS